MTFRHLHSTSGLLLSVFIGLHLFNHAYSLAGIEAYTELMRGLRLFYRNPLVEVLLLLAVGLQLISGQRLFKEQKRRISTPFDRLQQWTGLYLAVFLVIHLSAVFAGRHLLGLDTNFYFAAAGLTTYPYSLFFIPYYSLAVFSVVGHIAAVHRKKMSRPILGISPLVQAQGILLLGICLVFAILYGMTNHFNGVVLPSDYGVLVGH
jgi:succinate dehydrogenase/fumarate reductase cytochrome b subunit